MKTILFRPPYGIDHQPETASEISLLPIPQSMGYLIVGARIDPHDWGEAGNRPPPPTDAIVKRVIDQASSNSAGAQGNIVLMHDGGGNRSHTVEALPQIIDALRAQGFEFVSVSDLLGQSRAQVMPPLTHQRMAAVARRRVYLRAVAWLRAAITFIFIAGILLVSGRALVVGLLALIEKLRPAPKEHPDYQPSVTVLIPAYNEEVGDRAIGALGAGVGLFEAGNSGRGRWFERPYRGTGRARISDDDPHVRLMHAAESWQALGAESWAFRGDRRNHGLDRRRHHSSIADAIRNWFGISPIPKWPRWPAT